MKSNFCVLTEYISLSIQPRHHLKIRPPLRGVLGRISALIIEVIFKYNDNNPDEQDVTADYDGAY